MKRIVLSVFLLALVSVLSLPGRLAAQEPAWIQIEAHPDLRTARERASIFARQLDDIHAFRTETGWYAIALGPYERAFAEAEVERLVFAGLVPGDSYVSDGAIYRRQFWPVDANAGVTAAEQAGAVTAEAEAAGADMRAGADPLALPEETLAEARRSEAALTGAERRALQTALKWFGYYEAAIDGAFGPGTRGAMADWQRSRGRNPTGVLTSRERAALMADYSGMLERLGLEHVVESAAGIELEMPLNLVEFDRYEPPFVHFRPKAGNGVRILLISQEGGRAALTALYDVMQTLEIVPLDGARRLEGDSFLLTGRSATLASYTRAWTAEGAVKGFTAIWPPEMDDTMEQLVAVMERSFIALPGTLDPLLGAAAAQDLDTLSGLEIRRPDFTRSGFYIDAAGSVLTSSDIAARCARITVDGVEAELGFADDTLGVAVLRPAQAMAPMAVATFRAEPPRLRSEIAVAGYSFGGRLGAPSLTFGTLTDLAGLAGEAELRRLSVATEAGDAGGPVIDAAGAVLGVLVPRVDGARQLPGDVHFAAAAPEIANRLRRAGLEVRLAGDSASLAPEDLTRLAGDFTVLVSCWN
jgi:S1-C subfamily serine protease